MLVSVQGGLCSVNIMSLQAVVVVVRRAYKTDWQAELSLFELLPARAFPTSISVSFLVPALTRFPFPASMNHNHGIPHTQFYFTLISCRNVVYMIILPVCAYMVLGL